MPATRPPVRDIRRLEIHDRCSECSLVYQPDHGDTLIFMVITDRIPLLAGIAAV